jgi:hypothetical protein
LLKDLSRLVEQHNSRLGEFDAARQTAEWRRSQFPFQLLDLQAQRWLLDTESLW